MKEIVCEHGYIMQDEDGRKMFCPRCKLAAASELIADCEEALVNSLDGLPGYRQDAKEVLAKISKFKKEG